MAKRSDAAEAASQEGDQAANRAPKLLGWALKRTREVPSTDRSLPVAMPALRQPSFLAPHGMAMEPIAANEVSDNNAANQTVSPPNAQPTASGWTKLWQHLLGGTSQPPPNQVIAAGTEPPATPRSGTAVAPAQAWKSSVEGSPQRSNQQVAADSKPAAEMAAGVAPMRGAGSATTIANENQDTRHETVASAAIGSDEREGVVSALWRPLTLKQDAPPVARPDGPSAAGAKSGQSGAAVPHVAKPPANQSAGGIENSPWLQPFYMTNGSPAGSLRRPIAANGAAPNQSGGQAVASPQDASAWASGFFRQFSMSSTDDLRTPSPPVDSVIQPEPQAWNEGWTVYFPSIANPFAMKYDPSQPANVGASDTRLVAFLQEGLPLPDDLDVETGESIAGSEGEPATGQSATAQGEGAAKGLAEAESLGKEPVDNSLEFLRAVTVLLKPGESQFDIGVTYLLSEIDFPILLAAGGVITGVDEAHFRTRELSVPMEYRMGLTNRVQGFIGVPVGWANAQVSIDSFEAYKNDGGIGDVNFGLTMQLVDATVDSPYWVATIAGTAPTGGDPFTGAFALAPSGPSLGQGFWSIAGNLLFIQPYDPLVVFYGVSTRHYFSRRYVGVELEPGAEYSYVLGVGFAVSDRVTLSSRFRGSYVEEIKVDGQRVLGANLEPMTMRFSATISKPCDRLVEPFVEFGLTNDSISSYFGVVWTY